MSQLYTIYIYSYLPRGCSQSWGGCITINEHRPSRFLVLVNYDNSGRRCEILASLRVPASLVQNGMHACVHSAVITYLGNRSYYCGRRRFRSDNFTDPFVGVGSGGLGPPVTSHRTGVPPIQGPHRIQNFASKIDFRAQIVSKTIFSIEFSCDCEERGVNSRSFRNKDNSTKSS